MKVWFEVRPGDTSYKKVGEVTDIYCRGNSLSKILYEVQEEETKVYYIRYACDCEIIMNTLK